MTESCGSRPGVSGMDWLKPVHGKSNGKRRKSMEEILAHFFEGTELKEGVEIVQVEGGAGGVAKFVKS